MGATALSCQPMTDDDTFSRRVRRYARVVGAMGGQAARLAGECCLGVPIDPERGVSPEDRARRYQGALNLEGKFPICSRRR
jgi:hypothetical protein